MLSLERYREVVTLPETGIVPTFLMRTVVWPRTLGVTRAGALVAKEMARSGATDWVDTVDCEDGEDGGSKSSFTFCEPTITPAWVTGVFNCGPETVRS